MHANVKRLLAGLVTAALLVTNIPMNVTAADADAFESAPEAQVEVPPEEAVPADVQVPAEELTQEEVTVGEASEDGEVTEPEGEEAQPLESEEVQEEAAKADEEAESVEDKDNELLDSEKASVFFEGITRSDGEPFLTVYYNTVSADLPEDDWIEVAADECSTEAIDIGTAVYIGFKPADNRKVTAVRFNGEEIGPDDDGIYTITVAEGDNKVSFEHDVIWHPIMSPIIDDAEEILENITFSGATKSGDYYRMTGEPLSVSFNLKEGTDPELYDVDVDYLLQDPQKDFVPLEASVDEGVYTYTVPDTALKEADDFYYNVTIRMVTSKKTAKITYYPDALARIKYISYDPPVVDGEGNLETPESLGEEMSGTPGPDGEFSVTCDYGTSRYFVVDMIKEEYYDQYEVSGVEIDGEFTAATVITYICDGESAESAAFFGLDDIRGDHTVRPVLVSKAVPEDEESSFTLDNQAVGAVFAIDKKYATADPDDKNKYTFGEGVTDFEFAITTDFEFKPVATLGSMDAEEGFIPERELDCDEVTSNPAYTRKTYKFKNLGALAFRDKVLKIGVEELPAPRLYFNPVKGLDNYFCVTINGRLCDVQYDDDRELSYAVIPGFGAGVVIKPELEAGYKLLGIRAESEFAGVKQLVVKNGQASLTVFEDTFLSMETQGQITMFIARPESGEWTISPVADKGSVTVTASDIAENESYTLMVREGDPTGAKHAVTAVTARSGKKEVPGFAKIDAESGDVDIYPAAAYAGYPTVTLTVEGDFGKKTVTFTVPQKAASVSIKGFKNGKVSQTAGTEAAYAITLNKGADINFLTTGEIPEGANYSYGIDTETKKLFVRTYAEFTDDENVTICRIATEEFNIELYDLVGTLIAKYTVVPTAVSLAAPEMKFSYASDKVLTFAMSNSKAVKDCKNILYVVEASAVGTPAENMCENLRFFFGPAQVDIDGVVDFCLARDTNIDGSAQKYNIAVTTYQLKDSSGLGRDELPEENIFAKGKSKVFKNLSTKDPCYENKLSITRKATSFVIGGEKTLLAVAKFSAKTSYYGIRAELKNDKGVLVAASGSNNLTIKGNEVYIYGENYSMTPGKYTLCVYPAMSIKAYSEPATMTVTLKPHLNDIKLSIPSDVLYKADKKAASMKVTATAKSTYSTGTFKPTNSKINWSVETLMPDNDTLLNALTIKNGTVTVNKNYVLSPDDDYNTFRVRATAAAGASPANAYTDWIVIDNVSPAPAVMTVGELEDEDVIIGSTEKKPEGHYSSEYYHRDINVYAAGSDQPMDISDMTISVTPKTGFYIEPGFNYVTVTKAGTYTVKITKNDGSRQSITRKFTVKNDELQTGDSIEAYCNAIYSNGSSTEIGLFDGFETTLEGISLLDVSATYKTSHDGIFGSIPKISVTGGKVTDITKQKSLKGYINTAGVLIKPTGSEVVITVKTKTESKVYKFKLQQPKGTVKPESKIISLVGTSAGPLVQSVSYQVEGVDCTDGSSYMIGFTPTEENYGDTSTGVPINYIAERLRLSSCPMTDNTLTTTYNGLSGIPVGTYSFYIAVWEWKPYPGYHVPITEPLKVSIKIVDTPMAKVAIDPEVTVRMSELEETGGQVTLKFKTKDNVYVLTPAGGFFDGIVDGQPSGLSGYFYLTSVSSGYGPPTDIAIGYTGKPIPEGTKSMTGYVQYWYADSCYRYTYTKYEKITVIIE
jgi:hypothetical protein